MPTSLAPFVFVSRVDSMEHLILTSSSGFGLMLWDRAEVVVPFVFRLIWGPLPSPDELAT